MKRPLPLLPWALAGGLCCLRPPGVDALVGPTNQPATPGQDSQECGFFLLPERFQIWPMTSSWFSARSAGWESMDRATFVTCYQGIFPWIPQSVHCFVDSKLLFKSEVFADSEKLPGEVNLTSTAGYDTVVLRDCNHVVQYALKVDRARPGAYKIYNSLGELVAQTLKDGQQDGLLVRKDVMRLNDEEGMPVAIAQSPVLQPTVSYGAHEPEDQRKEDDVGMKTWQIKFFDAYTSRSSLLIAQNRWVLAAVVQDRALRDAWEAPSTIGRLFIPATVLLVLLGVLVCAGRAAIAMLFRPHEKLGKGLLEAPVAVDDKLPR